MAWLIQQLINTNDSALTLQGAEVFVFHGSLVYVTRQEPVHPEAFWGNSSSDGERGGETTGKCEISQRTKAERLGRCVLSKITAWNNNSNKTLAGGAR